MVAAEVHSACQSSFEIRKAPTSYVEVTETLIRQRRSRIEKVLSGRIRRNRGETYEEGYQIREAKREWRLLRSSLIIRPAKATRDEGKRDSLGSYQLGLNGD